ncbi:MAG: metal-dependent hydrolase, partial [Lachnospiraceae bacterium]|nr:metal-dependent hydrolase [Lachnospiraceae bacterium]
ITQDADAFVEQVRKLGVEARALKPGEELEV